MRWMLPFFTILLQLGCLPGDDPADSVLGDPLPPEGRILIEELYYSGAPEAAGVDHYFSDQFIEVYNRSEDVVAVGGLLVGDAYGLAGEINPGSPPDSYASIDPDRVYLENVWRIPGEADDVLLFPGETLVLAQDGTNHQPFSSVDCTGADFEAYVEDGENDEDYPLVPNLESVHFTGGYDWLMTVFGPSVVLLSPGSEEDFEDTTAGGWWDLKSVPVAAVIDGIDSVMDADSAAYKRLPDAVDAGFTHVSDTYTGESVRRLQEDGGLVDTDDSTADFEVSAPSPYGL